MPNFKEEWLKAGITNDFIFGNVMRIGNNCRDLLRAILPELHIRSVQINTQKVIHDKDEQKGVRLDVYAKDERERIYNVEMQVINQHNLGKRIRYYQSKIDTDSLGIGKEYGQIAPSYIIFLLPFDPYDMGRRRYTFWLRCNEDCHLVLDTQATVILLNSTGHRGKATTELQGFFDLMNGQNKGHDRFNRQIVQDIGRTRQRSVSLWI